MVTPAVLRWGKATNWKIIESIPFPHSPAWIFSQVSDLIGFAPHGDEHKTQWLGLEGDPVFEKLFLEILRRSPGKLPHLATGYFNSGLAGHIAFSPKFYRAVGVDPAIGKAAEAGSPRPPISEPLRETACRERSAGVLHACRGTGRTIPETNRHENAVPRRRTISESRCGFARGKKHGLRSGFRSARCGK